MSEEIKCKELHRLYRYIELDKPIPEDFLTHARNCDTCLYWLTNSLAIKKACLTAERIKFADCPQGNEFYLLFLARARTMRLCPALAKTKLGIFASQEETGQFLDLQFHIEGCDLCTAYYTNVSEKIAVWQKNYELKIMASESVRPQIEDKSEERLIPTVNLSTNPDQKPN